MTMKRASLHLDFVLGDYDSERQLHASARVPSSVVEIGRYLKTIGIKSVVALFDPSKDARIFEAPLRAPHVTLLSEAGLDEYEMEPQKDGRCISVRGAYSEYDGESSEMLEVDLGMKKEVDDEFDRGFDRLLAWLKNPESAAMHHDDRGLMGPVDGVFACEIDRSALVVWSEFYKKLNEHQREKLRFVGFDEVHVQFDVCLDVAKSPFHDEGCPGPTDADTWRHKVTRHHPRLGSKDAPEDAWRSVDFLYLNHKRSMELVQQQLQAFARNLV